MRRRAIEAGPAQPAHECHPGLPHGGSVATIFLDENDDDRLDSASLWTTVAEAVLVSPLQLFPLRLLPKSRSPQLLEHARTTFHPLNLTRERYCKLNPGTSQIPSQFRVKQRRFQGHRWFLGLLNTMDVTNELAANYPDLRCVPQAFRRYFYCQREHFRRVPHPCLGGAKSAFQLTA